MRQTLLYCSVMFLLLAPVASLAQNPHGEINVDLPALYKQIDEAVEKSPQYIAEYEQNINEKKKILLQTNNDEQRLMLLMELSNMYESFNGDSLQVYTEQAMKTAHDGGFKEIEDICMARLAYICTFLGSQTEALTILGRMQREDLNREALVSYYRAYMAVYSNLRENAQLPQMREEFSRLYQENMDSLLSVAPEGSETYLGYKEGILTSEGHLDEALEISDKRLDMSQAGTHENAIICYGRYSIYRQKGDMDLAKYWLCKSALDDVRNAVMDQMSLIALAELLDAEGDNERASKYISFTWECNRKFSPRMRSWQIAPLLSAIEQNYQEKVDKKSRILTVWTIVITVMLVIFIIGLFFVNRQRKQLRATKEDLEKANKELAQFNSKLELMNKQITKYNKQLLEINKSQSS